MKRIITVILTALLLAAPAASAVSAETPSTLQDKKTRKTVTVTYKVNMHCKKCVSKLTDNLSFLKGVEDLKISLEDKTVAITFNPAKTDEETLAKAIAKCGYTAEKITG